MPRSNQNTFFLLVDDGLIEFDYFVKKFHESVLGYPLITTDKSFSNKTIYFSQNGIELEIEEEQFINRHHLDYESQRPWKGKKFSNFRIKFFINRFQYTIVHILQFVNTVHLKPWIQKIKSSELWFSRRHKGSTIKYWEIRISKHAVLWQSLCSKRGQKLQKFS